MRLASKREELLDKFASVLIGHRLREHIYRKHHRPSAHQCPRCFLTFDDKERLDEHVRAEQWCEAKSQPLDAESVYVSENQYFELKQRERGRNVQEEVRWNRIYTILFPGVSAEDIPSPCEWHTRMQPDGP